MGWSGLYCIIRGCDWSEPWDKVDQGIFRNENARAILEAKNPIFAQLREGRVKHGEGESHLVSSIFVSQS